MLILLHYATVFEERGMLSGAAEQAQRLLSSKILPLHR